MEYTHNGKTIFKSEKNFQAAAWKFLSGKHKVNGRIIDLAGLVWHTKNEGQKSAAEASQDMAQGLLSGVPDLSFIWAKNTFYIELKMPGNDLSPAQKNLHKKWNEKLITHIPVIYPEGEDGLDGVKRYLFWVLNHFIS